MEKPSRSSRAFRKWRDKFYLKLEEDYPTIYGILYDKDPQAWPKSRRLGRFTLGLLMALFIHWLVISDLQMPRRDELAITGVIALCFTLGCVFSLRIRCITLLSVPGFCSGAGRSVLRALVVGYIIAGPVLNLTYNAKEVIRCFACTTQLSYNLTKLKYELMLAPLKEAAKGVKESEEEIRESINTVNQMVEPIKQEIEGEEELEEMNAANDALDELEEKERLELDPEDAAAAELAQRAKAQKHHKADNETAERYDKKRYRSEQIRDKTERAENEAGDDDAEYYEAKYRGKLTARCQYQLTKGALRCRKVFAGVYDKCYEAVTWVAGWLLCWPMKLTFACDIVSFMGGDWICNPEGHIDPGIGKGYVTLKETRDKFVANLNDTDIKFASVNAKEIKAKAERSSRATHAVVRDFEIRRRIFMSLVMLIKRFFSLVFLRILFSASHYHWKYINDIEWDNVYITAYFRYIDARREKREAETLLPLKKLERTKLIDPYALKQSKREKRNLMGQTVKLILEIMMTSTFVFLDKIIYEILDTIRRHSQIDISTKGHHDVVIEIKGKGLMAVLVRALVKGVNRKRKIRNFVTNEACLPQPSKMPSHMLFAIYGSYFVVWLMLLCQAYVNRTRSVAAGYLYRRRQKRRILYLYNETLRRRRSFLRFARARVQRLARAQMLYPTVRFWLWLRLKYPERFGWLRRFECSRKRCSVCEDPEKRYANHRECNKPGCYQAYCPDCWNDIGEECVMCGVEVDEDSDEEDYQEDSAEEHYRMIA